MINRNTRKPSDCLYLEYDFIIRLSLLIREGILEEYLLVYIYIPTMLVPEQHLYTPVR